MICAGIAVLCFVVTAIFLIIWACDDTYKWSAWIALGFGAAFVLFLFIAIGLYYSNRRAMRRAAGTAMYKMSSTTTPAPLVTETVMMGNGPVTETVTVTKSPCA